jgi:WD40 repeat protein
MLSHKIHANGADVIFCLGTNSSVTYGNRGTMVFYLRGLRHFSGEDIKPLARFTPHKTPITSVEWHPDESMLAVTDDHGAYIYDLCRGRTIRPVRWTFHPSFCSFSVSSLKKCTGIHKCHLV